MLAPAAPSQRCSVVSLAWPDASHLPCRLEVCSSLLSPRLAAQVFTRNQRSVLLLRSPEFGLVAYVAVGATVRCLKGVGRDGERCLPARLARSRAAHPGSARRRPRWLPMRMLTFWRPAAAGCRLLPDVLICPPRLPVPCGRWWAPSCGLRRSARSCQRAQRWVTQVGLGLGRPRPWRAF